MVNDMTATFGLFLSPSQMHTLFDVLLASHWQSALSSAQNHDVADAKSFPPRAMTAEAVGSF
jgi:hypothetical protein